MYTVDHARDLLRKAGFSLGQTPWIYKYTSHKPRFAQNGNCLFLILLSIYIGSHTSRSDSRHSIALRRVIGFGYMMIYEHWFQPWTEVRPRTSISHHGPLRSCQRTYLCPGIFQGTKLHVVTVVEIGVGKMAVVKTRHQHCRIQSRLKFDMG